MEADHLYVDHVGRESFYGLLASMRGQLFRDEEFAKLYCPDNGRDSVPPSLDNLLADGIVQVARALARVDGKGVKEWGLAHDLEG